MLPGCGGFINIVHGVGDLIFCGTLTTGGLVESIDAAGIAITSEGRVRRFVDHVEQITFNAQLGLAAGKRISYITDRGVFSLGPDGLVLKEVVPGVDVERDIVSQIDFPVRLDPAFTTVPDWLLSPPTHASPTPLSEHADRSQEA
jgi:acyl CoA:acetate/3-ketoacid CoA transferase